MHSGLKTKPSETWIESFKKRAISEMAHSFWSADPCIFLSFSSALTEESSNRMQTNKGGSGKKSSLVKIRKLVAALNWDLLFTSKSSG